MLKIGDATRFTEPSATVRSGLYVQRDMASSVLDQPGVLWAISCPRAALVHRCGAELNPMCSGLYREKGHVQQRHGFIDATLSSPTGIARRPPRCCCLNPSWCKKNATEVVKL